jgi:hypothetical protein
MAYLDDRAWETRTIPVLASALEARYQGKVFLAGINDDIHHGTDLFWCAPQGTFRLACRVRKPEFLKYRGDFTIREDRPWSGNTTELEKIRRKDWADVYIYAFSDGYRMLHWSIFRMSLFNPEAPFKYMPGFGPGDRHDTVTRIYRIQDQPKDFLIDVVTTGWGSPFLAYQQPRAAARPAESGAFPQAA